MTDHDNRALPDWKGPVRQPDPTPPPLSKLEITIAVVCLLILVHLLLGCQSRPSADHAAELRALAQAKILIIPTTGDSMLPTRKAGESILVGTGTYAEVQAGKEYAYFNGFIIVAHRAKQPDRFNQWEMQGDNNAVPDRTRMTRDNFIGPAFTLRTPTP